VPNLTQFASQGYDLIIASGFMLGAALADVAAQYPDLKFSIVDYNYPQAFDVPEGVIGHAECIPNVMGQVFKTDQAAYLAGYLGAGMAIQLDPVDPKLGYFGGMKIPTVTIFGVGYQMGMEAYNTVHGTTVKLLGWDNATGEGVFTDDFVDLTKGAQKAESLADEGADILMGVGGMVGSPAFQVAKDRGNIYVIWVDVDGYRLFPNDTAVLLTSVMKRMDNSQFDLIKATMEGNFAGCTDYIGDMANGGIELGAYHDLDSTIPADLKAEVDALKAKIISGELTDVGCISYPLLCPSGIYPAVTP
jgi:basic membrane protein A